MTTSPPIHPEFQCPQIVGATVVNDRFRSGWLTQTSSLSRPAAGLSVGFWARKYLLLSLALYIAGSSHNLVISVAGRGFPGIFTGMQALSLSILLMVVLGDLILHRQRVSKRYAAKLLILALLIAALAVRGIAADNSYANVLFDLWIYVYMLCFLYLGAIDRVWLALYKPLIVLYWSIFALALVGLSFPRPVLEEGIIYFLERPEGAAFVYTVGYEVSRLLNFWPIIFVMSWLLRGRLGVWPLMGLAAPISFLFLQFLFHKRAPTLRVFAYLLFITFVSMLFHRIRSRNLRYLCLCAFLACILAAPLGPHISGLVGRFVAESDFYADPRFLELKAMLADMAPLDYLIGKGLGGAYNPPPDWVAGITRIKSHDDALGRESLHIGFFHPLLKGGIVLMVLLYSFFLKGLKRRKSYYSRNVLNLTALMVLPVYILFLFVEGPPGISNAFDGFLFAFTSARLGK